MKRAIKSAIKAAGLNAADFRISTNEFESLLENVKKGNAQMNKVAKELRNAGYKIGGFKAGYGAWIYKVNPNIHYGHTVDYSNPASSMHY